jgi:hypothetical protein
MPSISVDNNFIKCSRLNIKNILIHLYMCRLAFAIIKIFSNTTGNYFSFMLYVYLRIGIYLPITLAVQSKA